MTEEIQKPTPTDARCPSCGVVVLRKERYDPNRHLGGMPDFCPKCGESLAAVPAPIAAIPLTDARCPSCKVVVLRKERYDPNRQHGGAPDFCPKCGEPIQPALPMAQPAETPLPR